MLLMNGNRRYRSLGVRRALAVVAAVSVAVFGGPGPFGPATASAVPAIILVTTTSDDLFPADLGCSLRAAITASNSGSAAGYCLSGTAEADSILFSLGASTATITVASALPNISAPAVIDGGTAKVRIQGAGSGTGLNVTATGVTLKRLIVQGFGTGIDMGTSGVVSGSEITGNGYGIYAFSGGAIIGGTTGLTPGGACTGDCNLISGNSSAGLYLASSGTVLGNHIGVNKAGTAAQANGSGFQVSSGTWTIGSAVAGNVISGNTGAGLFANGCKCTIAGNRIGTNAAGTAAVPNGGSGISLQSMGTSTIGGVTAGTGNIISGNTINGIMIKDTTNTVTITGNRIGTIPAGALGNGGDGIYLNPSNGIVSGTRIGGVDSPLAGNEIAYNGGHGVTIEGTGYDHVIRGNSIHDNVGDAIVIVAGANLDVPKPVITGFAPVHGTACANCTVDIYSDAANESRTFDGTTTAAADGTWSFDGFITGPNVLATATKTGFGSSGLSAPVSVLPPFTDIASSPFKREIEWLYAQGITTGCTSTTYCPSATVTRDQMASFLVRMFDMAPSGIDAFTDDAGSIHEEDINALAAAGITTGCTATTYCPDDPVYRSAMASFIVRAAGFTTGGARNYFSDDNGNIHEPNINRAAAAGVASGCGSYVYCPWGSVTREQMAAFLYRIAHPVTPPPYPAP